MVTLGGSDAYTAGQFFQGLTADAWQGPLALPAGRKLTTVVPGQAEGPIVGGNLTVLTSLVGTPYALDGMGCILVLEDTGEDAYRIDRMLNQLWQSGLCPASPPSPMAISPMPQRPGRLHDGPGPGLLCPSGWKTRHQRTARRPYQGQGLRALRRQSPPRCR